MKKLISILSSFVSVFSTASIVVSCGNAKPQSGRTGEIKINTQLLNKILSDDGIDGSSLNTNSTGNEVLSLIKKAITNIETTAKNIKYENANEENIVLHEGDNPFKVSFDVKEEHLIFLVIVRNIKNINYSDDNEIGIYINTILEDEDLLEMEYKNQDLNVDDVTKWKKFIGQKIHEKVPNATINIKMVNGSKQGELNVVIEVDNLPYGIQKITKQILYIPEKASRNKSNEKSNSKNFDDTVREIGNWTYNNNTFTVHNKARKEVTFFIEKEIKNYFKSSGLCVPQNVNTGDMEMEMGKSLNEGVNEIKIRIKNPQTNKNSDISIILNGVKSASKLKVLKEIKFMYEGEKKFEKGISPTYEQVITIYQKWLEASSRKEKIKVSLKDHNKLNQKLSKETNFIVVNYNEDGKTISGIIRPFLNVTPIDGTLFNTPGDGNCLFWSYATAYLLSMKNNDEEFKVRFEELFGNSELTQLTHVQKLLKQFNLNNKDVNQSFYNDNYVNKLVTQIFRNRIVDYIQTILKTSDDPKKDILESAIKTPDGNGNVYADINDYLQKMKQTSTWGGHVEIMAMMYMLKCNIIVVNENNAIDTKLELSYDSPKSKIILSRTGDVHYNFYLSNKIK